MPTALPTLSRARAFACVGKFPGLACAAEIKRDVSVHGLRVDIFDSLSRSGAGPSPRRPFHVERFAPRFCAMKNWVSVFKNPNGSTVRRVLNCLFAPHDVHDLHRVPLTASRGRHARPRDKSRHAAAAIWIGVMPPPARARNWRRYRGRRGRGATFAAASRGSAARGKRVCRAVP
jgi:hypothetical protein